MLDKLRRNRRFATCFHFRLQTLPLLPEADTCSFVLESVATIGIGAGTTRTPAAAPRCSDLKNSHIEYTTCSGYVQQFWQEFEILTAQKRRIRLFRVMIKDVTPHTSDPIRVQRIPPPHFTDYSAEFFFCKQPCYISYSYYCLHSFIVSFS